jgi:hypothetical protein
MAGQSKGSQGLKWAVVPQEEEKKKEEEEEKKNESPNQL